MKVIPQPNVKIFYEMSVIIEKIIKISHALNLSVNEKIDKKIIEDIEKKMEFNFPDDYINFIKQTNGLETFCEGFSFGTFEKIQDVKYFHETYSDILEVYTDDPEEDNDWLYNSVVVSGLNEESLFLISNIDGNYIYHRYGAWIPGFEQFSDFNSYLQKYLDDLSEFYEESLKN